MNQIEIIIVFLTIMLILFCIQNKYDEVELVESSIDKHKYLVQNLDNKTDAANMLARLNNKIRKLIDHLKSTNSKDTDIDRLDKNYTVENISEGSNDSNYTSYSVNKGEKIVFCLRQKDSNAFVSENVLMYVATHELSHLMTKEIGHTDTFWKNFKFLLEEAIKIGVYSKHDFESDPMEYCGLNIKYSVV